MKLRVGLVDDHQVFREGLRALIIQESDLKVVGEAADAVSAYAMVENDHPDVVVVDLTLPGIDGIAATREIKRRQKDGRVLLLSMHGGEDQVAQAFAAGASGYALKSQSSGAVLEAIRSVGRGDKYLPPGVVLSHVEERLRSVSESGGPLHSLSNREREVFALLVRGLSNQGVASELCISIKTVETHRAHIHRKLRVHSIAELVRFAALNGLITH
jgi:DNA-binding NarL/FixJ family response regulator